MIPIFFLENELVQELSTQSLKKCRKVANQTLLSYIFSDTIYDKHIHAVDFVVVFSYCDCSFFHPKP